MIINYIKKKLLGYSLPQEFACVALEEINDPLLVTLSTKDDNTFLDVSKAHLFLGYKPLVIGISVYNKLGSNFTSNLPKEICLSFHEDEFRANTVWKDFTSFDGSVARMTLKKQQVIDCGDHTLHLFEGTYARHEFISAFNQFVNRQKEKQRVDRKVNINLFKNLADQVQTAYSIPRVISLVTISENNKMNMFPTDLHGQVNNDFYIGSLRHGGKANEQVEKFKSIVLSRVDLSWCKEAYALGKNHMQDPQDFRSFPLQGKRSSRLNFPLPERAISYHELQHVDAVDIGIHRIHNYRILNAEKIENSNTLSHIHRFYAQWRLDNGKSTKFHWR